VVATTGCWWWCDEWGLQRMPLLLVVVVVPLALRRWVSGGFDGRRRNKSVGNSIRIPRKCSPS
jgi:hypothetical protein